MRLYADHFSSAAGAYTRYRPSYPDELYDYLAELAPGRGAAWDCATGNGQAAGPLAARFRRVLATDASLAQLSRRASFEGVHYAAALAEAAPLADGTIDLLTVSQALHWFAFERFFAEAERVLVPGGVLAAWTYDMLRIDREIDALVDRFYSEVVSPYWPPERAHVESRYETIPFPFERLTAPDLVMSGEWRRDRLIGYVGTWSGVASYREQVGEDPVPDFERQLKRVWPEADDERAVKWQLTVLVGRTGSDRAGGG